MQPPPTVPDQDLPPFRTNILEKAEAGVEPLVEMIVARMTHSSVLSAESISWNMSNAVCGSVLTEYLERPAIMYRNRQGFAMHRLTNVTDQYLQGSVAFAFET
jgi:hypothetical protein